MTIAKESEVSMGTILIVTTNPEFLRSIYLILGNRGYHLNATQSVGRGLKQIVSSVQPELVIIDIMMPLMTGVKTALRLRRWVPARTILLTAWEAEQDTLRRLDVDSPSCLSAPIKEDELIEWVDAVIKRQTEEVGVNP